MAIFDMTIDRQPDPKGDRVKIGMTGKFLPFKQINYVGALCRANKSVRSILSHRNVAHRSRGGPLES